MSGRIGPSDRGIVERAIGDEMCLYDPSTESVAVLNSTATIVWQLCRENITVEELIATLSHAYGVERESIVDEVEAAVEGLLGLGFLIRF